MKGHTKTLILTLSFVISCFLGINSTSALTYQDNLDVSFTFDSSISVSLSSDNLTISSLSPDTYADSNIVTVTTSTNNPSGYTLTATTGNSETYANTNLIDSTNIFTSLSTSDSISSMSSANASQNGRWGYSFSTNGTSWKNATGGTGYSGLPYYTASGAEIAKSTTNGTSNVQFKIGAKASTTQSAGTYKNVINFMATANPPVTRHYTVNYIDTSGYASGMPSQQTGILENDYIEISEYNPSYSGEGYWAFAEWCTEYTEFGSDYCYGDSYYPGSIINVSEGTEDVVINLYTVWFSDSVMYDEYEISVYNQSDATIHVDGRLGSGPFDVEPGMDQTEIYLVEYTGEPPVYLSVEAPASCPSNYHWNATAVLNYEEGNSEYYSGMGGDYFEIGENGGNYAITFTGYCSN